MDYATYWSDWEELTPRMKFNRVAHLQALNKSRALAASRREAKKVRDSKRIRNRRVQSVYLPIPEGYYTVKELCEKHNTCYSTTLRAIKYGVKSISSGRNTYIQESGYLKYREDMVALRVQIIKKSVQTRENKKKVKP